MKKARQLVFVSLLLFYGFGIFSCKKNISSEPHLEVLEPTENAVFSAGDTIKITVSASDEIGLKSVRVNLRQTGGINKAQVAKVLDGVKEATISLSLVLPNDLTQGAYTLVVTASNADLEKNLYVSIQILESIDSWHRLLVFSETAGITKLSALIGTSAMIPLWEISQTNLLFATSASDKKVWCANTISGAVQCLNDSGDVLSNDQSFYAGGNPCILDLIADNEMVVVSGISSIGNQIQGYTIDGVKNLTINVPQSYEARKLFRMQSMLVVYSKSPGLPGYLEAYNSFGVKAFSVTFSQEAIDFAPLDANRFLVLSKGDSGGGTITRLSLNDQFNTSYDFAIDFTPTHITEAGNGVFFVSSSDAVYRYFFDSNSLTPYFDLEHPTNSLEYDSNNHLLFYTDEQNHVFVRNTLTNAVSSLTAEGAVVRLIAP